MAGGFFGGISGVRAKNRILGALEAIEHIAALNDEDDAPELDGRDVDLLARRGQINLVTWLDD